MEAEYIPHAEIPLVNGIEDVIAYEQDSSIEERFPVQTSYGLFASAAERYGDDAALRFLLTGTKDEIPLDVSFRQLLSRITQTANALHDLGIGASDTVSIMLTNLLESHYAIWGTQAVGISSPLNPLLEAEHIIEIMHTTGTKMLITMAPLLNDPGHWEKVEQVLKAVPSVETLLYVVVEGYTETTAPSLDGKLDKGVRPTEIQVKNFHDVIAAQPADKLVSTRTIQGSDIASYFHTGGTTGRPKIAQVTHFNIAFSGQVVDDLTRYKGRTKVMSSLPLFHIYGLIAAGIATLYSGRAILMMTPDGFRNPNVLANWWHHAARFKINAFGGVPTILAALMQVPVRDNDLSNLEDVGSGAAPLPKQLRKEFELKYDVRVTNGWGMTETTSLGTRQRAECPGPEGSVGTRFPYTEMRTVELDGNRVVRDCEPNESGVLILRGPTVFKGYLHAEDNAKAWVDGDWFNTGDVAFINSDGFVTLTGRAKDLIIRGGHNIDPVMIEEPLSKHPAVAQVVAIGQPDAYAGELPVVYIELRPEFKGKITVDEIACYCQETIPERAAIPKRIEFIDRLPVTAVGKFFKPELRNYAIHFVFTQALAENDILGEITATFEQSRGHVATVKLRKPEQKDLAREVLEKFPVVIDFA